MRDMERRINVDESQKKYIRHHTFVCVYISLQIFLLFFFHTLFDTKFIVRHLLKILYLYLSLFPPLLFQLEFYIFCVENLQRLDYYSQHNNNSSLENCMSYLSTLPMRSDEEDERRAHKSTKKMKKRILSDVCISFHSNLRALREQITLLSLYSSVMLSLQGIRLANVCISVDSDMFKLSYH